MEKSYMSAVQVLNKRRRPMRPSSKSAGDPPASGHLSGLGGGPDLRGSPSIVGMKEWLGQLGHSTADINRLNIIHVAGTKGKGSTCAFIDAILGAYGRRSGWPRKTGLYTSPHLIHPEERIRIDHEPLSRDIFAKYFFEVHDTLSQYSPQDFSVQPRYLQLFALLSFHSFIREGVDVAIFETHHGGEYDATNVIERPVVTAVTSLGMDHVKQLGPSIENIAWHKAGIFKSGAPAFSAPQEAPAADVLRNRASEKGSNLRFIGHDPSLPAQALQLSPAVQRTNCSLALAVLRSFLDQKAPMDSSMLNASDISQGVGDFNWPGRFQVVVEDSCEWYLDGAHNEMSVVKAGGWFIEASAKDSTHSSNVEILIFSQISENRDAVEVFEHLATSLRASRIQHVILTTYDVDQNFDSGIVTPPNDAKFSWQAPCASIWQRLHSSSEVIFEPTIQRALEVARRIGSRHSSMRTLITGSQHLVGGALRVLKPN